MPIVTNETPTELNDAETLNQIVARYPQTLPVLQSFGLDTCCGGALSLRTAAEHHALDPEHLLDALAAKIAEGAER
jgi:iron-sulfur cluster repair protein YtfE (RIC family)